jgi:hypothetical protein
MSDHVEDLLQALGRQRGAIRPRPQQPLHHRGAGGGVRGGGRGGTDGVAVG